LQKYLSLPNKKKPQAEEKLLLGANIIRVATQFDANAPSLPRAITQVMRITVITPSYPTWFG